MTDRKQIARHLNLARKHMRTYINHHMGISLVHIGIEVGRAEALAFDSPTWSQVKRIRHTITNRYMRTVRG